VDRCVSNLLVVRADAPSHTWEFRARFRRHAFGWRSQPAIQRLKQAVSEIKKAARRDPVLGAEGAVLLLERLSPALEQVDSSSGAIGTAVNHAITELVPVIAGAPADARTRERWPGSARALPVGEEELQRAGIPAQLHSRETAGVAVFMSSRSGGAGPAMADQRPPTAVTDLDATAARGAGNHGRHASDQCGARA
jgi:hypothetical protein